MNKLVSLIGMYWRGSIRRQLIASFALASLSLMLGFGYLVFKQQRDAQYSFTEERAISLSHAIAISGTSWALTHDLVGLQEVVQGFARTQDLRRAFFVSPQGEVLASTNPEEIGFFVTDAVSRNMLTLTVRESITLVNQDNLVVIAYPMFAEGRHLGWVRVEMTRDSVRQNLSALTGIWVRFMLFAALLVSLIALLLARGLTHGLGHLMRVASAVERGQENRRADTGRADEIGILARHFDRMLDAIEHQRRKISESEARYRFLADNISDVIWIVNLEGGCWEYMSPSVEKLLGYSVDEIMAFPFEHTLSEHSATDIRNWIEERRELYLSGRDGSHVYTDEVEQRHRDGQPVWTEVTTHFARNEHGELILLGVTRNISERKKAEEQIRNLAFYDTLTQLPNRRLLQDRFNLVLSACKRNNRYAALMFMDLDNFKPLNDEHGHDVGDILLVEVARRITSCVREIDTVARFGGDEFVVILSDLDADREISAKRAKAVAEKIRQILSKSYHLPVMREEGGKPMVVTHHCTASIGVVLFNDHGITQEDLLKLADSAMYEAKAAGRNQVQFAET